MIEAFEWLFNQIRDLFFYLYDLVLDGFAAVLNSIPMPAWASDIGNLFAGIPADVIWWADAADLGTGLTIIFSAYGIRFLIRRIPVIG